MLLLTCLAITNSAWADANESLRQVRTFMYQLQGLERPGAIDELAASNYDMVVVEPTDTVKGSERFDTSAMVASLRASKPGRLVIAYIDIGEAESYRGYWKRSWRRPVKGHTGRPSFILSEDPDGWAENFPVAYWDRRWHKVLIDGGNSPLRKIVAAGFDGVYLDWVEAYDDVTVKRKAARDGVAPKPAMVSLIAKIRAFGRNLGPDFLVIAQNAPYLIKTDGYIGTIDAVGFESTWFGGKADAPWPSRRGGDIPSPRIGDDYATSQRLKIYRRYLAQGKPVFTIDYSLRPKRAQWIYSESASHGFVPLVTRVSLSRMTEVPPPWL